jgi:hypothetical protein
VEAEGQAGSLMSSSRKLCFKPRIDGSVGQQNSTYVMPALPDTPDLNRLCELWNVPKGCEAWRHKDQGRAIEL